MVGTAGHEKAKDYLAMRLEELDLEPYGKGSFELPYKSDGERLTNLIARLPGANPKFAPLLLGAHYNTCGPFPGADDNAAAIAIVLAVTEALKEQTLERDVIIALFDAEEPPHFHKPTMGSTVFYHQQRQEPIHCAIILDLIGHDVPVPGLEDLLFITGMESDPNLPKVLEETEPQGVRIIPALNRYVGDMSDHHAFRLDERPYLFLTCGRWQHYHMPTDTPDVLNYEKISAIAAYLTELIPQLARTPLDGPFEGYDSTPHELHFVQKHLGELASQFGLELKDRQGIDRLAATFLGLFRL
jgi:hypothetical protein